MNKNKNLISRRSLLQGAGATFVALEISTMTKELLHQVGLKNPLQ